MVDFIILIGSNGGVDEMDGSAQGVGGVGRDKGKFGLPDVHTTSGEHHRHG